VLLLAGLALAHGAQFAWNNDHGGSWSDPMNWSPHGVPGAHDDAVITPLASGTFFVDLDFAGLCVTLRSLTMRAASAVIGANKSLNLTQLTFDYSHATTTSAAISVG
jgi:hypothetical protein